MFTFSTDFRPSLNLLNHSNVLAWLKACSPKAFFSILWAFSCKFVELEAKFNANSLLLYIRHFDTGLSKKMDGI